MTTHNNKPLTKRIAEKSKGLTPLGRQMVDYLMRNISEAIFLSARELAEKNDVSLSTVVRFVQQLGYSNYRELLRDMREQVDTRMTLPDRVKIHKNGSNLQQLIEKEISGGNEK